MSEPTKSTVATVLSGRRAVSRVRLAGLAAVAFAVAAWGCSSSSEDSSTAGANADLRFHGEAPVFPDFSYDTGLVPAASPAQISLKLSTGGNVSVDVLAAADGTKLVSRPGGKLALDMQVLLEGRLKVTSSLKDYDGELPGLKDVKVPIKAEVPIDALLLDAGEKATVAANVPEFNLPEIPIAAIPGLSVQLTVAKESKVSASVHGRCAKISGGKGTYTAELTVSGELVVKAAIKLPSLLSSLHVPELAPITVPLPNVPRTLSLGPVDVPGVRDITQGACSGASSGDGGAPTGSPTGPRDGGSPTGSPDSGGPTGTTDSGAPTGVAAVTIDGQVLTVDSVDIWEPVPSISSTYDVLIKVSGAGIPTGTDLRITADTVGSTCTSTQRIYYREGGPTFRQFKNSDGPGCGLVIAHLPLLADDDVVGLFNGTLSNTDGTGATVDAQVSFNGPAK